MGYIITNLSGEREYISLPQPLWEGNLNYGTGVKLKSIYYGNRTLRMVLKTDSIWGSGRNDGTTEGTQYREVNESDFLAACKECGIEPPIKETDL